MPQTYSLLEQMPPCQACKRPVQVKRRKFCQDCSNNRVSRIPLQEGLVSVAELADRIVVEYPGALRFDASKRIRDMLYKSLYSWPVQEAWRRIGRHYYYPAEQAAEVIAETMAEGKYGAKVPRRLETALTEARAELEAKAAARYAYHIDELIHWYHGGLRRYHVG